MKKLNVIFIGFGPGWYAKTPFFQSKYLFLSKYMSGYIFTASSKEESFQIGSFSYQSCIVKGKFKILKYFIFCLINVFKIKRETQIDCIITYDPLITGFYGCILKWILKTKLIVEVNGVYTSSIVWADESSNNIKRLKKFSVPIIMRFALFFSDGIKLLFPKQIHKFNNLTNKKQISIFPDFVPVSYFKNLGEKKEILFVGFPFYLKGVDILIQSFKKVEKDFPDWKLKILGWYPDKTLLDKAIGDDSQIFHHPPVRPYDIPKHMGQCGIFVLPSRSEAMGRVLLEAAAAAKPRIGSNVDGIPTVINDGVDGFLIEPENVDQLAQKMSMLMADENLRETIGNNAYKRAMSDFSEDRYVEHYVDFIEKVVNKNH